MLHELGREGPFGSHLGLALAAPCHGSLPLEQAVELKNVGCSQHAQHVVHAHPYLAQVEILQGHSKGWGGSIEGQPSAWGSAAPHPSCTGALPLDEGP